MFKRWMEERRRRAHAQMMAKALPIALSQYGELLQKHSGAIVDESWLPLPKDTLKTMLKAAIASNRNEANRDALKVGWLMLANFQSGIGAAPYSMTPPDLPPANFHDTKKREAFLQILSHHQSVLDKLGAEIESNQRELDEFMVTLQDPSAPQREADHSESSSSQRAPLTKPAQSGSRILKQDSCSSITLGKDARSTIALSKDSSASTFLYLSAMNFLEIFMRFSADEDAADELKKDAKIIRDWLGLTEDDEIPDSAYERFARGFETFVMEYPDLGPLSGAAAQLADSLKSVYQAGDLLHPAISDKIRGVFRRMFVTQD